MKLKSLTLSPEMIAVLCTCQAHGPGGAPATRTFPRDAQLHEAIQDPVTGAWEFHFQHDSFPEVAEHETPPAIGVRHRLLHAYEVFLRARAAMSFAWGSNDCALFAADGILAMTGVDLAADFRGKYSDEAGAFALIASVTGGKTVADAAAWCAAKHGLEELAHPLKAQRGDLVIFPNGATLISGLVDLTGTYLLSPGDAGILRFPFNLVQRAWHA